MKDPNGPENDYWLMTEVEKADRVVVAWGSNVKERGQQVLEMVKGLNNIHCLGRNKDGSPKHPLYLKNDTLLQVLR